MSISKEDVLYIAALSKLNVSESEVDTLTSEMESIVGFADMLSELDVEAETQELDASALHNVFRDDIVTPSYSADILLNNAPCSRDGYYLVPEVK